MRYCFRPVSVFVPLSLSGLVPIYMVLLLSVLVLLPRLSLLLLLLPLSCIPVAAATRASATVSPSGLEPGSRLSTKVRNLVKLICSFYILEKYQNKIRFIRSRISNLEVFYGQACYPR